MLAAWLFRDAAIPPPHRTDQVAGYPGEQNRALDDDKAPRSHDGGDRVRYPLPQYQERNRRGLIHALKPERAARSP